MYFGGAGEGWRDGNNGTMRQVGIAISTDNCQTWTIPSAPQITFPTAGINTWAPTQQGMGRRVYAQSVVYHDGWFYLRVSAGYDGNRMYGVIRSQDGVTNWQGWENFTSTLPNENVRSNPVFYQGFYYVIIGSGGWRLARSVNPWGPWTFRSAALSISGHETPALFRLGNGWAAVSAVYYASGDRARQNTMKLWYLN